MEKNLLDDSNILSQDEILNLFEDDTQEVETQTPEVEEASIEEQNTTEETVEEKTVKTAEVDVDNLFTTPESVGSEEKTEGQEQVEESTEGGTSPNENFYSSIAYAFKEDGILPTLEPDVLKNIKTPEDLSLAIKEHIQKAIDENLGEEQLRVKQALDSGIDPGVVQQFEHAIKTFDNIPEEQMIAESQEGENIRKQVIYQDYINKGLSQERAIKEVKKSLAAGTDIEDSRYALEANKKFFREQYQSVLAEAKKQEEEAIAARKKEAETFRKQILEEKEIFEGLELDKNTRLKIYNTISEPVARTEDGVPLTALQKYASDNKQDFFKKIGTLYVLTDGFKTLDGLINKKANKNFKSKLREVEDVLRNTNTAIDGGIGLLSGSSKDPESSIGFDWELDLK